jgi:hypothetical protein
MLVNRNDANTVSGSFDATIDSWWPQRSHPWARTWLRHAVASAITASTWGAVPSFITNQLSADFPEARWKRFLSLASRWGARSVCESTPRLGSMAQKWRVERAPASANIATDCLATTASTTASGVCRTSSAVIRSSAY